MEHYIASDVTILCAAVADFTPEKPYTEKIKREEEEMVIRMKPTKDIASALGKIKRRNQILAGFALETNNELPNAIEKLKRKNFDFIVLNSLRDQGAGFGTDTNKITIVDRNNIINKFELKTKSMVAADIVDKLLQIMP